MAWRELKVSSLVSFSSGLEGSGAFSTSITTGCSMKSEYCLTIWRRRQESRNSLASSRRWRVTSVPRVGLSAGSTVNSPWPSDFQRAAAEAGGEGDVGAAGGFVGGFDGELALAVGFPADGVGGGRAGGAGEDGDAVGDHE